MYHKGVICPQVSLFLLFWANRHFILGKLRLLILSSCAFLNTLAGLKELTYSHTLTQTCNLSVSSRYNWLPDCSSGPIRSSKEEDGWNHRVYLRMLPVPPPHHVTLGKLLTCPLPQILFLPLLSPITHWVRDPSIHPAEVLVLWLKEPLFWTCCFFLSMLPATTAMVGSVIILLSRLLITVCCGSWD